MDRTIRPLFYFKWNKNEVVMKLKVTRSWNGCKLALIVKNQNEIHL